jgi:hypothetical protein
MQKLKRTGDHSLVYGTLLLVIPATMLIGLPLAGVALKGMAVAQFLEFPPLTRYVAHAPFSWPVFAAIGAVDLILLGSLGWILVDCIQKGRKKIKTRKAAFFPWWGILGAALCIFGWIMAWTRLTWVAPFQRHTFIPLWVGFIFLINALCRHRAATCLLTESPGKFLLLFPASSAFWWFFEYLNRFVQNWLYLGIRDFGSLDYVIFSSLSFSTVLPAVYSTYRYLLTFAVIDEGLTGRPAFDLNAHVRLPAAMLFISGAGLTLIGVLPDYLFPLLWVSPLLIITALQAMANKPHIFSALSLGDWRNIVIAPLAALMCGFLWELWNINSLAKWEYAVPFVHRFKIFEMPILGYGGYLPFGLECLMICEVVWRLELRQKPGVCIKS